MTSTITLITGEGNVRLYGDNLVLDLRAGGVDAMLDTQDKFQAKASEDNGATVLQDEMREAADCMTGEVSRVDAGRTASATSEGMDVTAGETASNSPSAPPAEAAPAFPKQPPAHAGAADNSHRWSKLRPHCLTPECCAGVGREHCHACKRAMADREAA